MSVIATPHAPQALGPYAQGRIHQGLLYVSGQLGIDPLSGMLLPDPDGEFRQVFDNLSAIAKAAGTSLHHSLKLTIFLADLGYFSLLNKIMQEYFHEPFPVRTTVEVSALPKGALLELDAILALPD